MADQFESLGNGRFLVRGELTFHTVSSLLAKTSPMFQAPEAVLDLDLAEVSRCDSAGIALLVEWLRGARAAGKTITFRHSSPQMRAIAQVSDLDQILPLADG